MYMSMYNIWAGLREDQLITPAPELVADFRPFGARAGPRKPWERVRLENCAGHVAFKISSGI